MGNISGCHIGIDISKECLDIAVHETGEIFQFPNDPGSFPKLIERFCGRLDKSKAPDGARPVGFVVEL